MTVTPSLVPLLLGLCFVFIEACGFCQMLREGFDEKEVSSRVKGTKIYKPLGTRRTSDQAFQHTP